MRARPSAPFVSAVRRSGVRTALLGIGLAAVFAQSGGQAQAPPVSLPYSNGYLVTGNYVAGGVDVASNQASGGFVTGTIHMSGVPANADVLAAFLYWEGIYS